MKCNKCGAMVNELNHFFIPSKDNKDGKRYCIRCAREEHIVTLV